jgi:uncharacterized BrkB/YihY/UPF0761 family membrane protein
MATVEAIALIVFLGLLGFIGFVILICVILYLIQDRLLYMTSKLNPKCSCAI